MKNAMKKLMAFALVAVMLVSAVPTAFADTVAPTSTVFTVQVMFNGKVTGDVRIETVPGDTVNTVYTRAANQKGINTNVFAATGFTWNGAVTNGAVQGDVAIGENGVLTVAMGVSPSHVHNGNWDAGVVQTQATCTTEGTKLYTCICGLQTTESYGPEEHDWEDANCGNPKTCKVCEATIGDPVGSHNWVNATCTAVKYCSVCGTTEGGVAAHTYNPNTPSCTVAQVCTVCGHQEAPAKGHTPGDAATCTHAQTCEDCGAQLAVALGHSPSATDGKCTRCGQQVGTMWRVEFYPNYNTNNTPHTDAVYEGANVYSIYTPSRYGYTFDGWYYDANLTRPVPTSATITSHSAFYAKWKQVAPKEVYVRVYVNGNTSNVYAIVDLYEWAQDHVITKADIEAAIAKHGLKAYNKAGLSVYGPFTPAQWNSYCLDDYYRNATERVAVDQNEKTVIYAMVHNVDTYVGSSSSGHKADSSNPKTGDMIFAPMMVLGASASALAALYYISKKRAI